jgi:DNA polymerase-3 subunit alpha
LPEQRRLNEQLLRLGPEMESRSWRPTTCHYVAREQAEAHDRPAVRGHCANLDTPRRLKFEAPDFYLKSADEMAALFADVPQAITNTRLISE